MAIKAVIILIILVIILSGLSFFLFKQWLKSQFSRRSLSVKYGKTTEQFLPFLLNYPYQPSGFRFLGDPIDGIQFEEDKILFIEFKTGKAELSQKQKRIKELVDKKRVAFRQIKI